MFNLLGNFIEKCKCIVKIQIYKKSYKKIKSGVLKGLKIKN